jgi:prophage antirepressor-like protein
MEDFNLADVNLVGADLSKVNLSGADLSEANLSESDLSEANLAGVDLSKAILWKANLQKADLRNANLRNAFLQEANLQEANLWKANLQEALEMPTEIAINGWSLVRPENLEGHWMTGEEIDKHLGYAEPRVAINVLYNRHEANFKIGIDVGDIKLISPGGMQNTRIFSERGVLKVIRYSNTEVADAVMDEVFDVYLAVRKKAKEQAAPIAPVPNLLPTPEETAAGILSGWMRASRELEVPKHYAQTEATKAARLKTGVDYAPLLLAAL